ncbi:MAG: ferric reductase-like transmembrane domain-containing protein [Desulfobacterales bacterium]|nr:ferric reductase-like transmembrane domain-containing protein [Desulfobacterales bacterium]
MGGSGPIIPTPGQRRAGALLCTAPVLALAGLALALPHIFESQSLYYKFGLEKQALRLGKSLGLAALFAMVLQLILAARPPWLERIFGLDRLWAFHARLGMAILALVACHFILVLGADGFALPRLEKRYWPEYLGLAIAILLLGLVGAARFRNALPLTYSQWKKGHSILAPLIPPAGLVHLLMVSSPYKTGLPRNLALAWGALLLLLILAIYRNRLFPSAPQFKIKQLTPAGEGVWDLRLEPISSKAFHFAPGQFARVTPVDSPLPREAHPFTLAGPVHAPPQFLIRESGDWTSQLQKLSPGTPVRLEGPFGLFSHHAYPNASSLIFLAGGIGITPIYSILLSMAQDRDPRPVILIWSLKSPEDIQLPISLDRIRADLPQLKIHRHYTGTADGPGQRLGREEIVPIIKNAPQGSHAFVCGPPPFVTTMETALEQCGISQIHKERFSF